MRMVLALTVLAGAAQADPVDAVMAAATESFDRIPVVQRVDQIAGRCGADHSVNRQAAYCTTTNRIYLADPDAAEAPYLVAHLLGHAVQVQHGVADVALRTIRSRPADEAVLRSYVESQVDCIAGFLFHRAGLPLADLTDWFTEDPFDGSHWGRDPLRIGPVASIGLAARNEWFQRGQAGDIARCAAGEFGAELLVEALN